MILLDRIAMLEEEGKERIYNQAIRIIIERGEIDYTDLVFCLGLRECEYEKQILLSLLDELKNVGFCTLVNSMEIVITIKYNKKSINISKR